jgi:hypothetical protein
MPYSTSIRARSTCSSSAPAARLWLAPTAIDPCLSEALGRPARSWSWTRASAGLWSLEQLARAAVPRLRPRVVALELSPEMMSVRHYGHETSARSGILPEDLPDCLAGASASPGWTPASAR